MRVCLRALLSLRDLDLCRERLLLPQICAYSLSKNAKDQSFD